MKKNYKSLTITLLTIFFLFHFLFHSRIMVTTFFETIKLWFDNLFPSIFIFFIITDILNNYNFPYYISKIMGSFFEKIYHLPKESAYIIFVSMTSGFPGNSKLVKEQLDNKAINEYDATKILTMNHFSNPLFILYTIAHFLKSSKIALIILIVHFLTNFIVGFCFRNIYQIDKNNYIKTFNPPKPFITTLKTSITNTFQTLMSVLGIIIFFALLTKTINIYLNLNPLSNMFLNGFLEITNGLNLLQTLSLSNLQKAVITTFFLSFGGFSIHMQIMTILSKYHINYYLYLIARLLHAALSSLIVFFLLKFFS